MVANSCEWLASVWGWFQKLSEKIALCTNKCNYSYIGFSGKIVASNSLEFTVSRLFGCTWGTLQTVSKRLQAVTSGYKWLQGVWLSGCQDTEVGVLVGYHCSLLEPSWGGVLRPHKESLPLNLENARNNPKLLVLCLSHWNQYQA